MYHLDETDRLVLGVLDEDPRMSVLMLAQRTGLARGTVQARLERYREQGLLRLASTRIPPQALGCSLAASVSVEVDQHLLEQAVAGLERIPEVLECFAPAGGTDLLVRVVARDPDDLYRVSEEIRLCPGVTRTSTSVFLREVVPYRIQPLLQAGPGRPEGDGAGRGRGGRAGLGQPSRSGSLPRAGGAAPLAQPGRTPQPVRGRRTR